jgi:hypothetical protein
MKQIKRISPLPDYTAHQPEDSHSFLANISGCEAGVPSTQVSRKDTGRKKM